MFQQSSCDLYFHSYAPSSMLDTFFQAPLGTSSWYSPLGSCLSGWNKWLELGQPWIPISCLQGGIYHGKMMESTMKRKDLEKKGHVKWDHLFPLRKTGALSLIPQPFDSALWKLHFKIFRNTSESSEGLPHRLVCRTPHQPQTLLPLTLPSISKCWCFRSCCKHPSWKPGLGRCVCEIDGRFQSGQETSVATSCQVWYRLVKHTRKWRGVKVGRTNCTSSFW